MLYPVQAQVWDLGRGVIHLSLPCHSSINAVRCSADGMAVVSGHFDGTLRFWDLRSGKLANEVTGLHTQQITSVAIGLRTGAPVCWAVHALSSECGEARHKVTNDASQLPVLHMCTFACVVLGPTGVGMSQASINMTR